MWFPKTSLGIPSFLPAFLAVVAHKARDFSVLPVTTPGYLSWVFTGTLEHSKMQVGFRLHFHGYKIFICSHLNQVTWESIQPGLNSHFPVHLIQTPVRLLWSPTWNFIPLSCILKSNHSVLVFLLNSLEKVWNLFSNPVAYCIFECSFWKEFLEGILAFWKSKLDFQHTLALPELLLLCLYRATLVYWP